MPTVDAENKSASIPQNVVEETDMSAHDPKSLRTAPLATPTDLKSNAVKDISGALNILLANMFTLYLKTRNFHWHVSGPHFRDYHLMLDEQGEHIFATTDDIAERVRKIGGTTIRSYRAYRASEAHPGQRCGLYAPRHACRTARDARALQRARRWRQSS
jgi:Ferritin-like domain